MRQHVNPLSRFFQQPLELPQPAALFSDPALPIHLDIGCARGRFLLALAPLQPQRNHLGVEIRRALVAAAEEERRGLGLGNLRVLFCNANISLETWLAALPAGRLERATIQFPDPWFKLKHHKRRVLQPALLCSLAGALAPRGELFLQSDVLAVIEPMVALVEASGCFERPEADARPWRLDNLPCVVRLQRSSGGLDFLSSDFAISVLGFHLAQKPCSHLTLDYPRRTVEFGFGGFRGPTSRHHAKASFRLKAGVPMARVSVGKVSWEAIVDTGSCFGVEIDQKLAQRLGYGTGGQAISGNFFLIGVGGTSTPEKAGVRVITVPRMSVLGSTFPKAQIDVMPGAPRIGSYFLQNYRVTFDLRRQLVWLEW